MPLVAIRIGQPASGSAYTLLLERLHGVDYQKFSIILNTMAANSKPKDGGLYKPLFNKLLGLAQSDRERECIRYTLFKATGMTPSYARKQFGFENIAERVRKVESYLHEVQNIQEAIDNLAAIEDTAFLATLGIPPDDSEESDCDELEETQFAEFPEPEEVHRDGN